LETRFDSFEAFWPFYLAQHSRAGTRRLHLLGTACAAVCLLVMVATLDVRWFVAAFALAYAFAWSGHYLVEDNHPATFTYPLWSLRGDVRMFRLWVAGRLEEEISRQRRPS